MKLEKSNVAATNTKTDSSRIVETSKIASKASLVRAKYDYAAAADNELSFSEGDYLTLLDSDAERAKSDWWYCEFRGNRGYVPKNYVDLVASGAPAKNSSRSVSKLYRAIYEYTSSDKDDLSVKAGEIIKMSKELDGWFIAELNGRSGIDHLTLFSTTEIL